MEEIKISKELLREVYTGKYIILGTIWIEGDNIRFRSLNNCSISTKINKYKFAYMCKEWAWSLGYDLPITRHNINSFCCKIDEKNIEYHKTQWADTEVEAIFKACDYILKELSNK